MNSAKPNVMIFATQIVNVFALRTNIYIVGNADTETLPLGKS